MHMLTAHVYADALGAAIATGGGGTPWCGSTMANCMLCRRLSADEVDKLGQTLHQSTSSPEHLIQNIVVSMLWHLLQDASLLV